MAPGYARSRLNEREHELSRDSFTVKVNVVFQMISVVE